MECIRGESKLNIKIKNSTLKFSFKRTGSHTTYQYPYIRFNMQYKIVNVDSALFLEERVTYYMSMGWILQGGVCVSYQGGDLRYYQAMIKTV